MEYRPRLLGGWTSPRTRNPLRPKAPLAARHTVRDSARPLSGARSAPLWNMGRRCWACKSVGILREWPPKVAIGLLWHDRAWERMSPRRSWAHPGRERQAPARFLLPARLRPFGALVLSCVPRGERAVGRRYRDDAPLGHPVVWQVDDIPLPVVLVFDDQRNRSHAVDCNCFVRERSDHPRFGVTRAHLTVPSRAIAGTGRRFAPSRDRMCGLTERSRPTQSRPAPGSLPR